MGDPQKTENRIIWSSNPTPGHVSGQNCNSKRYMYPYVHSSTIQNSQDMETPYAFINRWTDKDDAVHTHTHTHTHTQVEYYSATKIKQCHSEQHGCN